MLAINAEKMNDMAVVECKGRIVKSDSVFKLRDYVQSQAPASVIAVDLSAVDEIGGGGLGMLAFLQRWAGERGSRFKLFSPSRAVMQGLAQTRSILNFEIASFNDMMGLLGDANNRLSSAA